MTRSGHFSNGGGEESVAELGTRGFEPPVFAGIKLLPKKHPNPISLSLGL